MGTLGPYWRAWNMGAPAGYCKQRLACIMDIALGAVFFPVCLSVGHFFAQSGIDNDGWAEQAPS
jgi:hypothetical protein